MTAAQLARLEQIARYATRYEVTAQRDNGERVLIGYTSRRSRHGLLRLLRIHAEQVITLTGCTEDTMMTAGKRASDGFRINDWALRFTGRTQRQAIIEGELPPAPRPAQEVIQ